jgi:hypothetical protein
VKALGVLFLVLGALGVLGALVLSLTFGLLVDAVGQDEDRLAQAVLGFSGVALIITTLAASIPAIVCGWGLLRFRRWARTLGIVLAALSVLAFPLGTPFGVYALWVLVSKQTEPVFDIAT